MNSMVKNIDPNRGGGKEKYKKWKVSATEQLYNNQMNFNPIAGNLPFLLNGRDKPDTRSAAWHEIPKCVFVGYGDFIWKHFVEKVNYGKDVCLNSQCTIFSYYPR